ncbi:MAG TPA: protoglobin domain-containing protein [Kofleriaceae bacterium]|nr:protoglobin domain-containing protein [Kofleriaceae bacterium]
MSELLDELFEYVGLGADDERLLRELHPKLAPSFPAIADRFYAAVSANPQTSAILTGPAQVERLRRTLVDWMSTGLLGPYDDRFYEKRSRIGRRHVQIGLAQHYMFTAMNVVRAAYHDAIAGLYDGAAAHVVSRAVDKLLDIELAIMLRHYQVDSEERMLERERRSQIDRIAAMRTFTAGLAHEVRNPLNAARLQLELLDRRLRRGPHDRKLLEPSELANHEIERLTRLLDDFLAFARPPELHASEHDIVAIARHVVELEHPLAAGRGVELTLADHAPVIARVDSSKLHQVIQNLVRNGLEAAPTGGHVAVAVDGPAENAVHIRVSDDGPGIAADVLPHIYEPFFSTKDCGTGMGMAIVHSLIGMHGGSIAVATGPRGTTFDVSVPARG